MLHLSASQQYFLYREPMDLRKGFDSLSGIVGTRMNMNALDGSIFIFINRKRNQIKLLLWEGDGLAIYHKRLEKGTFELPQLSDTDTARISAQKLQFILQGVALKKVQLRKRYQMTI